MDNNIIIGRNVALAFNVTFINSYHEFGSKNKHTGNSKTGKIIVEDGYWVEANVTIFPVCHNCKRIINANSFVSNGTEPKSLYVAIARRIKDLNNDYMEKIIVIGAGISGLSIARMISNRYEVEIFEKESRPGGLVKCDRINGHLFHRTGGHVFNTKRQDILDWFFGHFDKDAEFIKANRNSVVSMTNGRIISYPIENHAYQFSDEMMRSFIGDLINMAAAKPNSPSNFEDFLRKRFGETLYIEYFQPYNEKIWHKDLKNVPLSWLIGKLPMPTLEDIIYNNFKHVEEKQFVHSTFFYPLHGGSQFLANRLAESLSINYNNTVKILQRTTEGWLVNGEKCSKIVFCGNIKDLPSLIRGVDISDYIASINNLEAHGTTTVLCEIEENPYSWIYMPSRKFQAHRIICTGNFSPSNRKQEVMSGTIEFTDFISKEDILDNLSRIPFAPKYLTHHYEPYTYPIQAPDTRDSISTIKAFFAKENFYILGRFAEWEYYNMDAAIGAALDLNKII